MKPRYRMLYRQDYTGEWFWFFAPKIQFNNVDSFDYTVKWFKTEFIL